MPQLTFAINGGLFNNAVSIPNASLTFFTIMLTDSISFKTFNIMWAHGGGNTSNKTYSLSVGLYSLTGSTLSIANSISGTFTHSVSGQRGGYMSISDTSANQNITPGTWFFGLLFSTTHAGGAAGSLQLRLGLTANPGNVFPGGFIGGAMTDSTGVLPSSLATSNLNITGATALRVPTIILTA